MRARLAAPAERARDGFELNARYGLPQAAAAERRFAKCRIPREKLVATKKTTHPVDSRRARSTTD
jgi:hypothetical protein